MERIAEEYDALQRKLQETETLLDTVQSALGLTRRQLESLPDFLVKAWRADYCLELAEALTSISKFRNITQFEAGTSMCPEVNSVPVSNVLLQSISSYLLPSEISAEPV